MKITTRLILSFLAVSILPVAAIGTIGLLAMDRVGSLALQESTVALRGLGEEMIHQRAVDVAHQVELYLAVHPELLNLPPQALQADLELAAIAVQSVGETGYTAVYDRDGVTHFHANPALVGTDLHDLAGTLPAFWAILEASLDGTTTAGYYDWQDADGAIHPKYMSCVPVGDTPLRVAATTYIDEFSRPIQETAVDIARTGREAGYTLLVTLLVVAALAVGLALALAWGISRPVGRLIEAATALDRVAYRAEILVDEVSRHDDLGQLARVFDRVATDVQAREFQLREQIATLRIEIDEAKRLRQVAEVTDTDYFRQLQAAARRMRETGELPAEPESTE